MMITSVNSLKGYWYKDGYIRTSSQIYESNDVKNIEIHLTNDAIQKHS
jgi:tubulin polyglutamylase TTLL1/tubulin monoglycylase TTLL3/8